MERECGFAAWMFAGEMLLYSQPCTSVLIESSGVHKGMMHGWSLFNRFLLRFDKKRLLCRLAFLATSDQNRTATWMLFTEPGYNTTSADLWFVSVAVVGGMILDETWMRLCCVDVGWRNVALFTALHINIYWEQKAAHKGMMHGWSLFNSFCWDSVEFV